MAGLLELLVLPKVDLMVTLTALKLDISLVLNLVE